MNKFTDFIKRNVVFILHIFVTGVLCVLSTLFFGIYPDYLFFGNLLCAFGIIYCLYKMLFEKNYAMTFLKIICILALLISLNQLYSYSKLTHIFPWIMNFDQKALIAGAIGLCAVILLIFKLLTYVEPSNSTHNSSQSNPDLNGGKNVQYETIDQLKKKIDDLQNQKERNDFFSFLRFLLAFVGLIIIILLPAILLYLFNKYGLDNSALDIDKVFSFLISYGSSFLLILFALISAIIVLVYIAKYIYILICTLKKVNDEDLKKSYPIPTYAISIFIVSVLMFLAWRITDFTLEDLTEALVIGDYLALPIAVIVILVLFFLLVQITHVIILLLSKMTAESIKEFIEKQEEKYNLASRIAQIIGSVIDIILDTILSTLEFVKFIPSFFTSLGKMVLSDEEDSDGEEDDEDNAGDKDGEDNKGNADNKDSEDIKNDK